MCGKSVMKSAASRPTLREEHAKDGAPKFHCGKKERNLGKGWATRPLLTLFEKWLAALLAL